jgi:hypothetical protein
MTTETDPLLAQQLRQLEQVAQTQIVNLQAVTEQAEATLTDIQNRVTAGQMGAELVAPLETAIGEAKDVLGQLDQALKNVQKEIEKVEK